MDLIPTSLDLAGAESAFINAIDRNNKLKKAQAPLERYYDLILIDTPPSLGFFTVNAPAAANEVIIPLQVQVYAYKALDQILPIIEQVKEVNPDLWLSGIVLTMYDSRNALTSTVEEMARKRFGNLVLQTPIPVNVRIAEAPRGSRRCMCSFCSTWSSQRHFSTSEAFATSRPSFDSPLSRRRAPWPASFSHSSSSPSPDALTGVVRTAQSSSG